MNSGRLQNGGAVPCHCRRIFYLNFVGMKFGLYGFHFSIGIFEVTAFQIVRGPHTPIDHCTNVKILLV